MFALQEACEAHLEIFVSREDLLQNLKHPPHPPVFGNCFPRKKRNLHIIGTFEDANLAAIHAKRVTIFQSDMQLVAKIRGIHFSFLFFPFFQFGTLTFRLGQPNKYPGKNQKTTPKKKETKKKKSKNSSKA